MAKAVFRVTEIREYEINCGDVNPILIKDAFESGNGYVADNWGWYDLNEGKDISYNVEIVGDK